MLTAAFLASRNRAAGRLADFARAQSAVAAVELALILPFLSLFALAGFETVRYVNMARQMTTLANSMASLIASRSATATSTGAVNGNDIIFDFNSAMVTFPQALSDPARGSANWWNYLSMTLSSVIFSPTVAGCTSGCTYTAKVDWSLGTDVSRSCKVAPLQVSDSAAPSLTTLPADVFTAGSIIAADLSYTFVPVFGSRFIPSATIHRSAYIQPRYMANVPMVNTGGPYGKCT